MTLIGLIGFIGSGKDTVADRLLQLGAKRDSFANPLKDQVAAIFGWRRELLEGHTPESREFRETPDMFWSRKLGIANFTPRLALQLIGTDVMRNQFHEDIWLSSLEYRLRCNADVNQTVVISDVRFANELELIQRMNGVIVWVKRGELPEWYHNAVKANQGNVLAKKIMHTRYRDVHQSEWSWAGAEVDYTIRNDGTLEQLYEQVDKMRNKICSPKLKAI